MRRRSRGGHNANLILPATGRERASTDSSAGAGTGLPPNYSLVVPAAYGPVATPTPHPPSPSRR